MSDTAITVQTVVDQSLLRARDLQKTNDRLTDAQMLIYLNKSVSHIQNILTRINNSLGKSSGTISLSADTQEYLLSGNLDDFLRVSENEIYFDDLPLTPITLEDKQRAGDTTTDIAPICFYITETHLGLVPIPTATAAAAAPTLNCSYYPKTTVLALTDNMPYKNALNEPISAFMDHSAAVVANVGSEEFTELYNTLEESTFEILKHRDGT